MDLLYLDQVEQTGDVIATYLFDTEGLDMYLPGNGILLKMVYMQL
jgi:hypothetical protein